MLDNLIELTFTLVLLLIWTVVSIITVALVAAVMIFICEYGMRLWKRMKG